MRARVSRRFDALRVVTPRHFHMRSISHLLVGLSTSLLAAGSLQAQVTFAGTTTGCFYQTGDGPCAAGSNSATVGPLTFTGTSFNVNGGPGGVIDLSNIGTFFLADSPNWVFDRILFNDLDWNFRLFVAFSSPVTTPAGASFTADFDGSFYINSSSDELDIDFSSSSKSFDYDGGSFSLKIDDVDDLKRYKAAEYYSNGRLKRAGQSGLEELTGEITCKGKVYSSTAKKGKKGGHGSSWTYVDTCGPENTPEPSQVPEPSSLVLLASGMAAFAVVARRRRNA